MPSFGDSGPAHWRFCITIGDGAEGDTTDPMMSPYLNSIPFASKPANPSHACEPPGEMVLLLALWTSKAATPYFILWVS